MNYRDLFYGVDYPVRLDCGKYMTPINFDNAATTPPLKSVLNIINENLKYYSSIERSTGKKTEYCTKLFEGSRDIILDFFNVKKIEKYSVIYVKSTTEGLNLLATVLMKDTKKIVLSTRMEHHANDLPWRSNTKLDYIEVDEEGRIKPEYIEHKLRSYGGQVGYVTITAASNVSGYVNDINFIASICHKYGAKIIVDAAQITAHRNVNMLGLKDNENIDFLVFSAHKVYAPFGGAAIIGLTQELERAEPFLLGGGIVDRVFDDFVICNEIPNKLESGTQNFFGVLAMATALKELKEIEFENIEHHEDVLKMYLYSKLRYMDHVILYGDTKFIDDRLGIIIFNIKDRPYSDVAETISKESGISLRFGKFCAHPYVDRIMGMKNMPDSYKLKANNGMIRASLALYNTMDEANQFLNVLENLNK